MLRRVLRSASVALMLPGLVQCGGGGGIAGDKPAVTSVSVSLASSTIVAGQSTTATAQVGATGGARTDVTWSSSDANVARVVGASQSATVEGRAVGVATITARSTVTNTIAGSATVTVVPPPDALQSVEFEPATPLNLTEGQSADLRVRLVNPQPSASASYSYSSSNPAIASVSALTPGTVRIQALAPGGPVQVTATVSAAGTGLTSVTRTASVAVTVAQLPAACTGISITPRSINLAPGQSEALVVALVQPQPGASPQTGYTSSNTSVATVSNAGVVTAVSAGNTTIQVVTVCAGPGLRPITVSEPVSVVVTAPPALLGVSLAPSSASVRAGQQVTLTPSFERAAPSIVVNCSFASDSVAYASVNNVGVVTGVSTGRATITATCVGSGSGFTSRTLSASALVTVTPAANACSGAALTPGTVNLTTGGTATLSSSVQLGGSGVVISDAYTTSASNIVTVSRSGSVIVQVQSSNSLAIVTAVAPGTATVTYTASCSGGGFVANQVTAQTTVVVTGSTAPAISRWTGFGVGGPVRADQLVRGWVANANTWFVGGDDNVAASGGGLWRTLDGGVNWEKVADSPSRVTAIAGTSANSVWFGTQDGRIYQFDGGSAVERRTTAAEAVQGLYVSGSTVYALMGSRRVERSVNGGAFQSLNNAVLGALNLYAINGTGASDVYVAGDSGIVLRFDGAAFTRVYTVADRPRINAVVVLGGSTVLVGGTACGAGCVGRVARQVGGTWAAVTDPGLNYVDDLAGSGPTDVYAYSYPGDLRRFDGVSWSSVNMSGLRWNDGRRIMVPATQSPVIVGSTRATVQQLVGTTWTTRTVLPDIYDAHSSAGGLTYFVGDTRTLFVSDGVGIFSAAVMSQELLFAVYALDAGDVVTGGFNSLLRIVNGVEVSSVTVNQAITDIDGVDGHVYAIGALGGIWRWNGTGWSSQSSPTSQQLNALWMANDRFGMAVGNNGTVLRYNGTTWQSMAAPVQANLAMVWGADSSNAYAALANGQVYRWNGSAWSFYGTTDGLVVRGGGANTPLEQYLATTSGLRRIANGTVSVVSTTGTGTVVTPWWMNVRTGSGLAAAVAPNGMMWTGRPAASFGSARASLGASLSRDAARAVIEERGVDDPRRWPREAGRDDRVTVRRGRLR